MQLKLCWIWLQQVRVWLLWQWLFLKLSAEEKDQYMRYINMSRHYISDYVVNLTPYSEEVNKTVKSNRDPTALFHNVSNYDLFVWMHYYATRDTNITWRGHILSLRMTGRGFLRGIDCICWLGEKKPYTKLVMMKNFALPYWDWTRSKTQCDPAICSEELLGVTNQVDGTVKANTLTTGTSFAAMNDSCFLTKMCDPTNKKLGLI